MGVGGDMFRGLFVMAAVGFVCMCLVALAAVAGLAYLIYLGVMAVLGG